MKHVLVTRAMHCPHYQTYLIQFGNIVLGAPSHWENKWLPRRYEVIWSRGRRKLPLRATWCQVRTRKTKSLSYSPHLATLFFSFPAIFPLPLLIVPRKALGPQATLLPRDEGSNRRKSLMRISARYFHLISLFNDNNSLSDSPKNLSQQLEAHSNRIITNRNQFTRHLDNSS